MDTTRLLVFAAASLVLVATPGPGVLYVVARSTAQGRRAGLASVLGLAIGDYMHALAAAVGLSAIITSSDVAFATVKYLGAAYLVYLGLVKLLHRTGSTFQRGCVSRDRFGAILRRGIVVAVLNPKTAVFFLAFPPQFVDPALGAVSLQLLILGSITVTIGLLSDSLYALLSSAVGNWLQRQGGAVRCERYVLAVIYCSLGAITAFSDPALAT